MLKIGEFSKLSHMTVKALRFYEKEGILEPATTDEWTGYRWYETSQLVTAAKIMAYRQLGLSIDEIKSILAGADEREILRAKTDELSTKRANIEMQLSIIRTILEEKKMEYKVTVKTIEEKIVFTSEATLAHYADIMQWIPSLGAECIALNPDLKCAEPEYEFCEYLDPEYKEENIRIRHSQAVTKMGKESDNIKFRVLPKAKVLSIYHKGPYEKIPEAYAFIYKYAEQNGYECADFARECYIDGIWNKENPEDWLTEVQLPIK